MCGSELRIYMCGEGCGNGVSRKYMKWERCGLFYHAMQTGRPFGIRGCPRVDYKVVHRPSSLVCSDCQVRSQQQRNSRTAVQPPAQSPRAAYDEDASPMRAPDLTRGERREMEALG